MSALSIPTGFRTTESLDVAVALAAARQGANDGDMRLEFHRRGLFTDDLKDEYPLVRDVPISIVRDRVLHARAAEARAKAAAKPAPDRTTSSLVAAVKAAVAAPVVETAPSPAPASAKVGAPRSAPRPPAPSVRPPEPAAIPADHVKCCRPGCSRHDLPRHMRVKPLRFIEAELGRLPTEQELRERAYCQIDVPMRDNYPLDATIRLAARQRGSDRSSGRDDTSFGKLGDLLGAKLRR